MCIYPSSRLSCGCSHRSAPAIREYDAKLLLAYWLERAPPVDPSATVKTKLVYPSPKVAQVSWDPATNTITPDTQLPGWVFNTKLVAKPDQLIKRRGKAGLLALNKTWDEAKPWIQQRAGKPQKVSTASRRTPIISSHGPWHVKCSDAFHWGGCGYPRSPSYTTKSTSLTSCINDASATRLRGEVA